MKWMLEKSILAGIWKNPRTWWWVDAPSLQLPGRASIRLQRKIEADGRQVRTQVKLWHSVDRGFLRDVFTITTMRQINHTQFIYDIDHEPYPKTSLTRNWIRWHSLESNQQDHKVDSTSLPSLQLLRSLLRCSQWIVLFQYQLWLSSHLFLSLTV